MASESTPPPLPGARPGSRRVVRIGKYEVSQHIANGGMGAVYRGRDLETNRAVALKILLPEMAAKPAMRERFQREAKSAAKLRHENIVTLYEFDEVNGTYFIAMEYVDGIDLHEYVRQKGTLDPEEAREVILQGARALRHAHDRNIVHRDVKPSNFLLIRKEDSIKVKLTDFGLAREVSAEEFRVTRAGTTVGTLDYMSPEQARDSNTADIRSDLYSLGCTWYHLLTGHGPFPEGGLGERLNKIMNEEPPDVRDLNPRVSDETWAILCRLLAKAPEDRYPSPGDLIEDLLDLEGSAVARRRSRGSTRASRVSRERQPPVGHRPSRADRKQGRLWLVLAGVACLVAVAAGLGLFLARRPAPTADEDDTTAVVAPAAPAERVLVTPAVRPREDQGGKQPGPITRPPDTPRWATLYRPAEKIDHTALRREIEAPWANAPTESGDAFIARVSRGGAAGTYRSLAEACTAAPAGKPIVLEVHDNGPLHELPVAALGRDLTIRAGKGYRPLILWDLPATLQQRRRLRQDDQPLRFVHLRQGRLVLEGLEVSWRWPETLAETATVLDVEGGELIARACTFSAAGKPPGGVTLVRFHADKGGRRQTPGINPGARCRLERCHARGTGLCALDLNAPGALVLLDGCLLVGGRPPLLRVVATDKKPTRLRIVRSTLLSERTLLELKPAQALEHNPAFSCLCWDSLLSRYGAGEGGTLFSLGENAETGNMEWRAVNTLYAGWRDLLGGSKPLSATDLSGWQRLWKRLEGDGVAHDAWPSGAFNEPATQSALAYQPAEPVGFASSQDPDKPLGCDLALLPPTRNGWIALALEPSATLLEAPTETVPDIPNPGDGRFHGAKLDLNEIDLGTYLAQAEKGPGLGPKVVLHLTGKGDRPTSPIRVKGSSLVLYFEEPADADTPRLALRMSSPSTPAPLLDVEDGSVEVYGGILRVPDVPSARASYVVRVKGGDVRLFRTRIEGPQQNIPGCYQGAVAVHGSADQSADRARGCALNECVVVSGRAGIVLDGVGCRMLVRQSLLVSGTEALTLLPGDGCKGQASMQCVLENVTFAARRAVLRLGDARNANLVTDPVLVQARDCAYLNPFPGRPSKAGLLVFEGDALARGLLVWQGEREGFDQRLHFTVWPTSTPIPDKKEGHRPWQRLWGSTGVRTTRAELLPLLVFDTRRWVLERLQLRMKEPPGANLERLGISTRKPAVPR